MKPKIALLVTELSMGGAAKVVRDHAVAFRSFADVREIVFNRADGVDFDGDQVVSLDVGGGGGIIKRLTNFARRVRRYDAFKRKWRPDVSIAHLEGAHYVDILSRRGEKVILVLHGSIEHNRDIKGAFGFLRRNVLIPFALRRADAIVAVSRDIAREMEDAGIPDVRVVNNYFDVGRIEQMSGETLSSDHQRLFDGPPVIITAGRLAEQKNQAPLLEAFASLLKTRATRLVILGDGPLRGELLSKASDLGLSVSSPWTAIDPDADLHFLGVQNNPFAFIARSALFALPSKWEGFPLALCEAMASGTAVVSADCPTGPREILSPKTFIPYEGIRQAEESPNGLLMRVPRSGDDSVSAWSEIFAELLGDPARRERLAQAGRRRVGDFTAETIVPQWRALIDELLATSPNRRS